MRKVFLAQLTILMAAACLPAAPHVADQVLQHAIVMDTHADAPQMMLDEGYDLADPASPPMIGIPKMHNDGLGENLL